MASFNDYVKGDRVDKSSLNVLKNFTSRYEGMSEEDMIKQIVQEAEKNRKAGKLTNADLDNFSNMLMPLLNQSQQKKLTKIIARLKKI